MIAEGVLDAAGPRVAARTGCTCSPARSRAGSSPVRPGPADGRLGGLTSPYAAWAGTPRGRTPPRDPIVVAAEMVTALQTMVTRQFDVFDPVVVTVGTFSAGTRRNIIPETATFEATVRAFSSESMARLQQRCVRLCASAGRCPRIERRPRGC